MCPDATTLFADLVRRIRHFGDYVTLPVAILYFSYLAGFYRFPLVLMGVAVWTLIEYLLHRIGFHLLAMGRRLHQPHHDHPNDLDAERSSLSTPFIALPIALLLLAAAGVNVGSALFAGLLLGYLVFITIHYAVHRWPIGTKSWLYAAKMRHLIHHRFPRCNYGVTTGFWDVVFRTHAEPSRRARATLPASRLRSPF